MTYFVFGRGVPLRIHSPTPLFRILVVPTFHIFCDVGMVVHHMHGHGLHHVIPTSAPRHSNYLPKTIRHIDRRVPWTSMFIFCSLPSSVRLSSATNKPTPPFASCDANERQPTDTHCSWLGILTVSDSRARRPWTVRREVSGRVVGMRLWSPYTTHHQDEVVMIACGDCGQVSS